MQIAVYNGFRDHNDTIQISRTDDGWYIQWLDIKGSTDKHGAPYLFKMLDSQAIQYPIGLAEYMGYFWDAIQEEHLDDKAIQTELDRIGEWISVVERNKPVNIGRPSLAR